MNAPFVCNLSKKVKLGLQVMNLPIDGLQRAVASVVDQFEDDPALKANLKQLPPKSGRIMRQVDIRIAPSEPVLFKFFVSWNWKLDMWHVLIEGAMETVIEDGVFNA